MNISHKHIIILSCLLLTSVYANGQKLITFRKWQPSITAAVGHNYAGGYDLYFNLHTKISTSNWGLYAAFDVTNEKLVVDQAMPDYKEAVKSYTPEFGLTYSFYDKMIPLPLNVYPFFGIAYSIEESAKFEDGVTSVNGKTFGNSFGLGIEYYLTKNIAITLKQQCYLLYHSNFGNFRTFSSAGLTLKF